MIQSVFDRSSPALPVSDRHVLRLVVGNGGSMDHDFVVSIQSQSVGGAVVITSHAFSAPVQAAWSNFDFGLSEGYLSGVTVHTTNQTLEQGSVYIYCYLYSGSVYNDKMEYLLFKGYIFSNSPLVWPFGLSVNIGEEHGSSFPEAVSNPAPGGYFNYSMTSSVITEVVSLQFRLVTDANAANRQVSILLTQAAITFLVLTANVVQVASTTRDYYFAGGVFEGERDDKIFVPSPFPMRFAQSSNILSSVSNIQAGDQISNIRVFRRRWYGALTIT